jgi:hypothetical protein
MSCSYERKSFAIGAGWVTIAEDLMKAVAPLATLAAAGAAWFAAVGANRKWRRETISKLAEEILADVYHLRAILQDARMEDARSPSRLWFDATIKPEPGETDKKARYRTMIYRTIDVLTSDETNRLIEQLEARMFRFATYFKPKCDGAFRELSMIKEEVLHAAFCLARNYRDTPLHEPAEKASWERTIGWGPPSESKCKDPMRSRLEAAVTDIQKLCRRHMK